MSTLMISTHMVPRVWAEVSQILMPSVDRFDGYSIDDLYSSLLLGKSILWVHAKDDRITAAMIVRLDKYPQKLTCRIQYMAGDGIDDWINDMDNIEVWADAIGCNDIEVVGRKGWGKMLNNFEDTKECIFRKRLGE